MAVTGSFPLELHGQAITVHGDLVDLALAGIGQ